MTALSTLRLCNEESLWAPVYKEAQKHYIKDFDSLSAATTDSMPPSALPSVDLVPRPLRLAHRPDIEHTYIGGDDHGAPQRHRIIAPVDGEIWWFCCNCKDGPYSNWQDCCQNCPHKKCDDCPKEKK